MNEVALMKIIKGLEHDDKNYYIFSINKIYNDNDDEYIAAPLKNDYTPISIPIQIPNPPIKESNSASEDIEARLIAIGDRCLDL